MFFPRKGKIIFDFLDAMTEDKNQFQKCRPLIVLQLPACGGPEGGLLPSEQDSQARGNQYIIPPQDVTVNENTCFEENKEQTFILKYTVYE